MLFPQIKFLKSEMTKYAHIAKMSVRVILEKGKDSYETESLFFING